MRLMIVAVLASALAACSQEAPKEEATPAPPPPAAEATAPAILSCAAPFTADASAASLSTHFGAANVTEETVYGSEGEDLKATVLFAKEPAKRVEIFFHDEAKREGLASARVEGEASDWRGPSDLRLGETLEETETANGVPFLLAGFGWDMGGVVTDWKGGAFSKAPEGCRIMARFSPGMDDYPAGASGDSYKSSTLPAMRAAKPKLTSISVGWPAP